MPATIGTDIVFAKQILNRGGLVGIPTETVYGLAANGLNEESVAKIFAAKNRPFFDPLILHIGNISQMVNLVDGIPTNAQKLINALWPGPLTIIFNKSELVSELVTGGLPSVGIRMPNHPLTLELLKTIDFPLAAPSANPFGYVSPTSAQHVYEQLHNEIDYILDGGPSEVGIESTIVSFLNDTPSILRLGGYSQETIESIIGPVTCSLNQHSNPQAPGQLDQHYSPHCKLSELTSEITIIPSFHGVFYSSMSKENFENIRGVKLNDNQFEILTLKNSDVEAASNLFRILRELDSKEIPHSFIEFAPRIGLGPAINDRINRAMAKR